MPARAGSIQRTQVTARGHGHRIEPEGPLATAGLPDLACTRRPLPAHAPANQLPGATRFLHDAVRPKPTLAGSSSRRTVHAESLCCATRRSQPHSQASTQIPRPQTARRPQGCHPSAHSRSFGLRLIGGGRFPAVVSFTPLATVQGTPPS